MQIIMDRFLDWFVDEASPILAWFIIFVVGGLLLIYIYYLLDIDGAWLV